MTACFLFFKLRFEGNRQVAKMGFFMEVNMSLVKSLHGKQVFGILLVVVLLIVIFAYGIRAYRVTGNYHSMVPDKKACNTEVCKIDTKAETDKGALR